MSRIVNFFRNLKVSEKNRLRMKRIYYGLRNTNRQVKSFMHHGTLDFFDRVVIETTTYCNLRCKFCPNSKYERGLLKNKKLMKRDLFEKIIDELAMCRFRGEINLSFYGEPFSDERIIDFIHYIRIKLPKIKIGINTNGTLLDIEKYKKLVEEKVDYVVYDQYSEKILPNMQEILEYEMAQPKKRRILIVNKFREEFIRNRAGEIDGKTDIYPRCFIDPVIMIDYSGKVILCCNDYHSSIVLGDLNKEKLINIYNKEFYKTLRKDLKNLKFKLDICKKCVGQMPIKK